MVRRTKTGCIAAVVGLLCLLRLPGAGGEEMTYESLVRRLADLDSLPMLGSFSAKVGTVSSRDVAANDGTLVALTGPGCITRIWSDDVRGTVQLFLDGGQAPVLHFPFAGMFNGEQELFPVPLVWTEAAEPASYVSLAPIPFARQCRLVVWPPPQGSWHITYLKFPEGTRMETLPVPLPEQARVALRRVCEALSENGWDPQKKPLRYAERSVEVQPGKRLRLKLRGPAVVEQLRLRVVSAERDVDRAVTLAAYWDGEREPSIWAPIGPFFGSCVGSSRYTSLPLGADAGSSYCFLRMPFRKSAVFEITSEAKTPLLTTLRIGYVPCRTLPAHAGYLHARWRHVRDFSGGVYELLATQGHGRLAGVVYFTDHRAIPGPGEQQDAWHVQADEERVLSAVTPAEFFGASSGAHAARSLAGYSQFIGPYRAVYRWFLPENIAFDSALRVVVSRSAGTQRSADDLSSMVYWYQGRPHADTFTRYRLPDRLPRRLSYKTGVWQAEDLPVHVVRRGRARVIEDQDLPFNLDAGRGVLLEGETGDVFAVELPVEATACYDLGLPTYGRRLKPGYALLWNDQPVAGKICGGPAGTTLKIVFAEPAVSGSPSELILDVIALTRRKTDGLGDWMVIGPWDNPGRTGLAIAYPPEHEIDFTPQYTGKHERPVQWQKVHVPEDACTVDLQKLYGDEQNMVAYACCGLIASTTVETTLKLGSDDGIRAWLNGQLVHEATGDRATQLDQDQIPIVLLPGLNVLLLKIEQGGGGWSFVARIDDPENRISSTSDLAHNR